MTKDYTIPIARYTFRGFKGNIFDAQPLFSPIDEKVLPKKA